MKTYLNQRCVWDKVKVGCAVSLTVIYLTILWGPMRAALGGQGRAWVIGVIAFFITAFVWLWVWTWGERQR